jgi:hypothetical protein
MEIIFFKKSGRRAADYIMKKNTSKLGTTTNRKMDARVVRRGVLSGVELSCAVTLMAQSNRRALLFCFGYT